MSPSKWPRPPSHGKCSRRFCGSSQNCGRSRHQRWRKTFDGRAFKANKPEECVPYVRKNRQMRPSNAVRTVWDAEAIDTSHLGFRPIQKIATIHASSGFIRGIPNNIVLSSPERGSPLMAALAFALHILGAVVWVGGMFAIYICLRP